MQLGYQALYKCAWRGLTCPYYAKSACTNVVILRSVDLASYLPWSIVPQRYFMSWIERHMCQVIGLPVNFAKCTTAWTMLRRVQSAKHHKIQTEATYLDLYAISHRLLQSSLSKLGFCGSSVLPGLMVLIRAVYKLLKINVGHETCAWLIRLYCSFHPRNIDDCPMFRILYMISNIYLMMSALASLFAEMKSSSIVNETKLCCYVACEEIGMDQRLLVWCDEKEVALVIRRMCSLRQGIHRLVLSWPDPLRGNLNSPLRRCNCHTYTVFSAVVMMRC